MACCCCQGTGVCCKTGVVGGGCTVEKACDCRSDPTRLYRQVIPPVVGARGCCQCLRLRVTWCGLYVDYNQTTIDFRNQGPLGDVAVPAGLVFQEQQIFEFNALIGGHGGGPHPVFKRLTTFDTGINPRDVFVPQPALETRADDPTFCGINAYVWISFPWLATKEVNNFNRIYAIYGNTLGETSIALSNDAIFLLPPLSPVPWGWDGGGGMAFRNSIPPAGYDQYVDAVMECGFTTPTVTVLPLQNPLP
jgi:hypothetical protein